MRVSTKGDYGIRALVELAHRYGEGPVQSAEIARRQCIPEPYLDQLLTTLRRAGFIRSQRGPQGGHALLRPAEEIRLSDVIEALEGSLSPIACLDDGSCTKPGVCAPVIGATKVSHVEDAVASLEIALSDDDIATLEAPYRPKPVLLHR